ncbi:MAG: DUF2322 family protein [Nitrosomonadales bacterium]|jgi:hypothetical protein
MQNFKETLETLEDASHVKAIELYDHNNQLKSTIQSKPGTQGSIKVYHHLWKTFGELTVDAAIEGLDLYCEHVEDAQNNPTKHPNIDRLLDIIDSEETLTIKIIK